MNISAELHCRQINCSRPNLHKIGSTAIGRSNKNRTPKRTLILQLSFKRNQNLLVHVKKQSISSVRANFIVCIFNTYNTYYKIHETTKLNKNTMFVIMTQIVYTYYAVHIERTMFC